MGRIFFIFSKKIIYNYATKTHISNFQKIIRGLLTAVSDWLIYMFHYFTCEEWDFQLLNILFWDDSNRGNRFMLWFKIAAICTSFFILKLLKCVFIHREKEFQLFQILVLKYFFEAILLVLIRFMLWFKMGTVSNHQISKGRGASCAITCISLTQLTGQ